MSLAIWLKALRVPFFTATIIPVILGSVIAWHAFSVFSWPLFFIILIASICVHAGLNLANDYFDHTSGNDAANTTPTPFSGGSRVIQDKLISPKKILTVSIIFFVIAIALGLYLNSTLPGNTFLYIGVVGVFIAFFYTAPPLRLGYNGLGELLTGFGFGTLIITASFFVQANKSHTKCYLPQFHSGLAVMLILLINEFPDYDADKKAKKRNWVVLFEKQKAKQIYVLLLFLMYTVIIAELLSGILPVWSIATLITLPLALKIIRTLDKNYEKIQELLPANQTTIALHTAVGIILILSFVADNYFRPFVASYSFFPNISDKKRNLYIR